MQHNPRYGWRRQLELLCNFAEFCPLAALQCMLQCAQLTLEVCHMVVGLLPDIYPSFWQSACCRLVTIAPLAGDKGWRILSY